MSTIASTTQGRWERVYLVTSDCFNSVHFENSETVKTAKLFFSGQNLRRFTEKTADYYPSDITIIKQFIHPVSGRDDITNKLAKFRCTNTVRGFYTFNQEFIDTLSLYENIVMEGDKINNLCSMIVAKIHECCRVAIGSKLSLIDIHTRIWGCCKGTLQNTTEVSNDVDQMAFEMALIKNGFTVIDANLLNYEWKISKNRLYESYLDRIFVNWRRNVEPLLFKTVVAGARDWFVWNAENVANGPAEINALIPHKVERQKRLLALLTLRLGAPVVTPQKGWKGLYWPGC